MTLGRRAPRAVYRLYDQEEFLAASAVEPWPEARERGQGAIVRLASAAMLVGAVGALGGVVALGFVQSTGGARRLSRRTRARSEIASVSPAPFAPATQPSRVSRHPGAPSHARGQHDRARFAGPRWWASADVASGHPAIARSTGGRLVPSTPPIAGSGPRAAVAAVERASGKSEFGFER